MGRSLETPAPSRPAVIETFGLTREFTHDAGVWDLDLRVPAQSVYAFLGPNGAGKTTTIRLLLGLLRASSGRVLVDGEAVAAGARRRRWIGSMVEGPSLYPHLTGTENLGIAALLLGAGRQEIDRVLRLVGLGDAGRRLVKHYSLGMKQRLGIAMALLGDPALLILDEPTNGLDPAGMADLRDLLRQLVHDQGKTVFLSSHQLDDVEKIATHVGLLHHGRLVAQGDILALREQRVSIRCHDVARAQDLATSAGYVSQRAPDGLLLIEAPPEASAALNRMIVTAGIEVEELTVTRRSLAQYFSAMTGMEEVA